MKQEQHVSLTQVINNSLFQEGKKAKLVNLFLHLTWIRVPLISISFSLNLVIYDLRQDKVLHSFQGHMREITSLVVDESENMLYSCCSDGDIKVRFIDLFMNF